MFGQAGDGIRDAQKTRGLGDVYKGEVEELMPVAKENDPNNKPSEGVISGMSVMGFSLVMIKTEGIG